MNVFNAVIGVGTITVVIMSVMTLASDRIAEKRGEIEGFRIKTVIDPIDQYLKANYSTLAQSASGSFTVSDVKAAGLAIEMQDVSDNFVIKYKRFGEYPAYTLKAVFDYQAESTEKARLAAASLGARAALAQDNEIVCMQNACNFSLNDFKRDDNTEPTRSVFLVSSYTRTPSTLKKVCFADGVEHHLKDVTLKRVFLVGAGGGGGAASKYKPYKLIQAEQEGQYVWNPAANSWNIIVEAKEKKEQLEEKFFGRAGDAGEVREYINLNETLRELTVKSGLKGSAAVQGVTFSTPGEKSYIKKPGDLADLYSASGGVSGGLSDGQSGKTDDKLLTDASNETRIFGDTPCGLEYGHGGAGAVGTDASNPTHPAPRGAQTGAGGLVYLEYLQW